MHGYQVIQELSERSAGMWRPSPGSVYPTLQLLEDEGLVRSDEVEGKRVFHLTDAGRRALADFSDEWTTFRDSVDALLQHKEKGHEREH